MSEGKKVGFVKFWSADRGYGFLKCDDGGPDVFAHVRDFQAAGLGEPSRGARFKFMVGASPDGRNRAVDIESAPDQTEFSDEKEWDDAAKWRDDPEAV